MLKRKDKLFTISRKTLQFPGKTPGKCFLQTVVTVYVELKMTHSVFYIFSEIFLAIFLFLKVCSVRIYFGFLSLRKPDHLKTWGFWHYIMEGKT